MTAFGEVNPAPTRASINGRFEGARGMLKAAQDALLGNRPNMALALLTDARVILDAATVELGTLIDAKKERK